MLNKILFTKRIKVSGMDNVYLAPFVYDDKGRDNLHEPHYNLSTADIVFKGDIIQNMKKALLAQNIEYISADFTSNIVKFKFL